MSFPSYKRLFDLIPFLVDEEIGIISKVISLPRQANMPNFMYYKAIVSNSGVFGGEENFSVAGGTAMTRERALAKALGEGIERYSSALYSRDELVLGKYLDFPQNTVPPDTYATFSSEAFQRIDFPYSPFTEETILRWSQAKNLRTGLDEFVPAAMVYCPYSPDEAHGEPAIVETISTGLASHLSYEEAALNGMLEVVERDSFMLAWLRAGPWTEVIQDSLAPDHQEAINKFAQFGYDVTIFDITSDSQIPTFMGIMRGTYKGSVPFLASAATHLDPAAAILKCLEELALIERFAKRLMLDKKNWPLKDGFEKITKLVNHIHFWIDEDARRQHNFQMISHSSIRLEDLANRSTGTPDKDLEKVTRMINDIGYEVLIADITSPDVGALGCHVLRALIPGFLPLNIRYDCRPLNSKRLQAFLKNKSMSLNDINLLPHPFA